jgi:hypothetical protein
MLNSHTKPFRSFTFDEVERADGFRGASVFLSLSECKRHDDFSLTITHPLHESSVPVGVNAHLNAGMLEVGYLHTYRDGVSPGDIPWVEVEFVILPVNARLSFTEYADGALMFVGYTEAWMVFYRPWKGQKGAAVDSGTSATEG